MTIEEDLRLALRDEAEKPVLRPDLLDRVRVGVRQDKRRRTAMVGAAAVLVAIVTVPVVLAQRPQSHPLNPAPPATSDAAPSPSPSPSPPSSAERFDALWWEKPRLAMPTFPLTPGWLPAGLAPRFINRIGTNVQLTYNDGKGDVLAVEVGSVAGSWETEGEEGHRATVGGASATVRTGSTFDGARPGDRYVGVRWKLPDGQWAQAISFGPREESEVLRFVRGLRRAELPASPMPFQLVEVPRGLAVAYVSAEYMCLVKPPFTIETMQRGLCVGVESRQSAKLEPGVELTVGGRPAVFKSDSDLEISLGDHRVLTVWADLEGIDMSSDDIVRFATGVRVTGS